MGQFPGKSLDRLGLDDSRHKEMKALETTEVHKAVIDGVCVDFPLADVPDDILFEVLKWVPVKDIIRSCVYVCRQWKGIIDTQMFWKEKCSQDLGYTNKICHLLVDEDFKVLYFKRPYQNNLIENPDAREGLKYWMIHQNRGDQWTVEEPVGCHPLEQFTGSQQNKETKCWVSSYEMCSKSQTIDLLKRGCSVHILDEVRPDIHVSEWYAGRFDCGMEYSIMVKLLKNKNDKVPVKEWVFDDANPAGKDWFKAEHTFTSYDPGVRFIHFFHSGNDTQFWAGHYGAKMTLSSVILDLSHTAIDSVSQ